MWEENGRFMRKANSSDVSFSGDSLRVGGKLIVRKHGNQFLPIDPEELSRPSGSSASGDALRERVDKVACLLDEGRQFEAILIASMYDWVHSGQSQANKANFNPDEPRDDKARWTSDGPLTGSTAVTEVQYRGYFHDVVVEDLLKGLESKGGLTLKNVRVLGINGIFAIPDGASLPNGRSLPYFIEVKTGYDPDFTPNQKQVYPLICMGGHASSFDPRIKLLGLIPGVPFPPLDIMLVHTYGPGLPLRIESYCDVFGFRKAHHGA